MNVLRRLLPFLLDTILVVASGPKGLERNDLSSDQAALEGEGNITVDVDTIQAHDCVNDLENETTRPSHSLPARARIDAAFAAVSMNHVWRSAPSTRRPRAAEGASEPPLVFAPKPAIAGMDFF
jgi:hypothetical protein